MTPISNPPTQSVVILERLENQRCDIVEIKEAVKEISMTQNEFVRNYTQGHTELVERNNRADERISVLEKQLKELADQVEPLLFAHKILVWVAIFFGSAIGFLVWGVITHTITIGIAK